MTWPMYWRRNLGLKLNFTFGPPLEMALPLPLSRENIIKMSHFLTISKKIGKRI